MKKLIIILLMSAMCSTAFGQVCGKQVIITYPHYTIYINYNIPSVVIGSEDSVIIDTCWIGEQGYIPSKNAGSKLIPSLKKRVNGVPIKIPDYTAYNRLKMRLSDELEKRGDLEMTRPDGNIVNIPKSNMGKAFNQAKVDFILQQIMADPTGTQVEGVFELKGKE